MENGGELTLAVCIDWCWSASEDICYEVDRVTNIDGTISIGVTSYQWYRCWSTREDVLDEVDDVAAISDTVSETYYPGLEACS
jgi:hypothetical protein